MKQIETRLSRLERLVPANDRLGVTNLSSHELELMLHDVRGAMIADPETSEDERERLRQNLAKQEAAVRAQLAFFRRPDIADAIVRNRADGAFSPRDSNTIDWGALAEAWGIS